MQELLTKISSDEIAFLVVALSSIAASFLSIISKNVRTTVICFLASACLMCSAIALVSELIFAIVFTSIYVSIASLFFTFIKDNDPKQQLKWRRHLIVFVVFIMLMALYVKLPQVNFSNIKTAYYSGIAGITLIISILLIYVIFGIVSTLKKDK